MSVSAALVTRACPVCLKRFTVHPGSAVVFCSQSCNGRDQARVNNAARSQEKRPPSPRRVRCVCRWCSTPFLVVPSKAKEGRGRYCSTACSARAANDVRREQRSQTRVPADVERAVTASCCPYTRETWPACGRGCLLNLDADALTCITHGRDIARPHGQGVPCDACRGRWGRRPAVPEPPAPWSTTHQRCRDCHRTDRHHRAFGLCRTCYERWARAGRGVLP